MPHAIYRYKPLNRLPHWQLGIELASVRQAAPLTTALEINSLRLNSYLFISFYDFLTNKTHSSLFLLMTSTQPKYSKCTRLYMISICFNNTHFSTTSHHCFWIIRAISWWFNLPGAICCNPFKSAVASQAPHLLNMAERRSVNRECWDQLVRRGSSHSEEGNVCILKWQCDTTGFNYYTSKAMFFS